MHGIGPRWDVIQRLFEVQCARLGFERRDDEERLDALQPEAPKAIATQGRLFET